MTDLDSRTKEEWHTAAEKWFEIASNMKPIQDELTADLEKTLLLCQDYQRIVAMLNAPDPNMVAVRELFTKYKMEFTVNTNRNYGVYLDGQDITDLGSEEEQRMAARIEKVELVVDEQGKMHFRPVVSEEVDIPEWSEGEDVEPVEDADLEWLND